jgi:uncharacterized protein YndB with AHSA1/START domain
LDTVEFGPRTAAPAQAVWEVLADTDGYVDWVSGAARIRDADLTWPAVGSRLYHPPFGPRPAQVCDGTVVAVAEPPWRLVLLVGGRPDLRPLGLTPDRRAPCPG